ncbi:efflux transporter periplasmic adaptor subunit [Pseudoxanthomonas broegbernensis]|uniref:Efflux transporter periplasmic adaptor subunit n=1 Tax=Pseudoxanthomonas broegbernensis TaxID=83619 RepID=A0A7V8K6N0_9GAMM|nr:efflux RND transporter periplasmic adaptor subunit [Pseudoxanthomonas broegbernensis]KAF1685414.1 efflux transporter periplasmic adaptor subunit [Pseudoxanthomonas broegbernensis]MBB6064458.1 membrane fusion protein (multidrug efflux system) [Pseudoxanthomonas broegbernensis]
MSPSTPPRAKRPPSTARRMVLMLAAFLVVFGGVFAVWAAMRAMTNQFFDNMPQPPVEVSTYRARAEHWTGSAEAVGSLVADNGTEVTTEAGGVVREIAFESGQPVKKGDLLVQLNTANELAQLKALDAAARLAATQRERWRELGESRLVSRADVEQRATDAASTQAQAEAQRALIAQKTIRAPFDGVLGIRRVNLGQYLGPGDPIVNLQALDPIHADFSLPEQRMGQVAVGTKVALGVDALPDREFEATITALEPSVDAGTRNFAVRATLANPDGALRPGTFARVGFDLGQAQDVVVVPQTAVSFNPYGNSVYVLVDAPPRMKEAGAAEGQQAPQHVVKQRFVTTGPTRGDLVGIIDGLAPGEVVVSSGLLRLRNDAAVIVNNKVQPAADQAPTPENR